MFFQAQTLLEKKWNRQVTFFKTINNCVLDSILNIYLYYIGNRYILPIWLKTPAKQAPLDLRELETNFSKPKPVYDSGVPQEFVELHKKESDI